MYHKPHHKEPPREGTIKDALEQDRLNYEEWLKWKEAYQRKEEEAKNVPKT